MVFATWPLRRPARPSAAGVAILAAASLALSTLAIWGLRSGLGVTYPAPVYLLAVLAVGVRYGTLPAILTSFVASVLYDFLFVQPLYTFTVASPDEWLNLLLLLAVAVVIGRLAALLADRAREAADRAREAEALHAVTGILAATRTVAEAAPVIVTRLEEITAMDRVWVGLGPTLAEERALADTAPAQPVPALGWQVVLQRRGDGEMKWSRAHVAGRARGAPRAALHRVRIEVAGETLGSLWAFRARNELEPDRAETRILCAAADQLGQAVVRDRLTQEATSAEIARQSEALKTALLDSVSHDLRTPLATIRAAAGSMLDASVSWSDEDRRGAFLAIDAEAERMGRLVRNLLDLSRIEGGALKPDLQPCDLEDVIRQSVRRARPTAGKHITLALSETLPPALGDELYLGQVIGNLLENALRYGGDNIRVDAAARPDGTVEIGVEDDGRGVPASALPHLFEKFYQAGGSGEAQRRGMGIGLTVVEGLTRAMQGRVEACRGAQGGLRVDVLLLQAAVPEDPESPPEPVDDPHGEAGVVAGGAAGAKGPAEMTGPASPARGG